MLFVAMLIYGEYWLKCALLGAVPSKADIDFFQFGLSFYPTVGYFGSCTYLLLAIDDTFQYVWDRGCVTLLGFLLADW